VGLKDLQEVPAPLAYQDALAAQVQQDLLGHKVSQGVLVPQEVQVPQEQLAQQELKVNQETQEKVLLALQVPQDLLDNQEGLGLLVQVVLLEVQVLQALLAHLERPELLDLWDQLVGLDSRGSQERQVEQVSLVARGPLELQEIQEHLVLMGQQVPQDRRDLQDPQAQ